MAKAKVKTKKEKVACDDDKFIGIWETAATKAHEGKGGGIDEVVELTGQARATVEQKSCKIRKAMEAKFGPGFGLTQMPRGNGKSVDNNARLEALAKARGLTVAQLKAQVEKDQKAANATS